MIGQIGYLGQVSPTVGHVSGGLYIIGCALGTAVMGVVLGSCGWLLLWLADLPGGAGNHATLLPVALLALVGGLRDLRLLRLWLPQPDCQVPRYWLPALGPYRTAFLWGLNIGAGIRTRYRYAILHVLALWIFLSGDPLWGAGILGLYGTAHGVAVTCAVALNRVGTTHPMVDALPQRTELFFTLSGACLVATSPLLLLQALA